MEEAKDIDALTSIRPIIEKEIENVNSWIEKEEVEKKREREIGAKRKREDQGLKKKILVLDNRMRKIEEQQQKDVFEGKYLIPKEKAELDILQNYQKRKKVPVSDITLFLKERKLIIKVNYFTRLTNGQFISDAFNNSYFERFGEILPFEVYWAADGQVYPLNYFNSWDRALLLIQIRIDKIKRIAIQNRKNKLMEERNRLNKEEQILKRGSFPSSEKDVP